MLRRSTTPITAPIAAILESNDWFWTITGVHKGGGVDASLVILKAGERTTPPTSGTSLDPASAIAGAGFALVVGWFMRRRKKYRAYSPLPRG